ncbi:MAG: helix-turn-helix domain-containing protein [Pseudomonadota bacterium]
MGVDKANALYRLGKNRGGATTGMGPGPGERAQADCAECPVRHACLLAYAPAKPCQGLHPLVHVRRRVRRGESLFRSGDPFNNLYAIRSGFFKTAMLYADGREQVGGFYMAGEMLGLNGIGSQVHINTATALEDGEVCSASFPALERALLDSPLMQRRFHKIMAEEIVREQTAMMLLGSFAAEGRLAAFLLNLAYRYASRGYSSEEFHLRMSREELGSYLGLTLETVSRTFSRLHDAGLVEVNLKRVRILDVKGLRRVLDRERQPPERSPRPDSTPRGLAERSRRALRNGRNGPPLPWPGAAPLALVC